MSMNSKYAHLRDVSIQKSEFDERDLVFEAKRLLQPEMLALQPKEWAEALGVSSRTIQYWRSGMKPIQKKYLADIAKNYLDNEPEVLRRIQEGRILALQICNLYQLDEIKGEL